jgi:NTE family protein
MFNLSGINEASLVLSGGGVKGVAHIALLEFLEEKEIEVKSISASSSGALVGALYCSGLQPSAILDFFKTTPVFKYTWVNPLKYGIFDSERYAIILEEKIKHFFEDLYIPLTITATNIEKNKPVYFDKGPITKPLLGSCAFPAVFSPVTINGELYSDGGVMDNFPVLPLLDQNYPILGSYVNTPTSKKPKDLNSILKVTNHANTLLLEAANTYKFNHTLHTFKFPVGHYGAFDSKKIDEIYLIAKDYLKTL